MRPARPVLENEAQVRSATRAHSRPPPARAAVQKASVDDVVFVASPKVRADGECAAASRRVAGLALALCARLPHARAT